ncbi:MAG: STAS domain-containing protein [Vicinamibacterales bacterium]
MEIKTSKHEKAVVLELVGVLDTAASREFDKVVQATLAEGARGVAIDLSKVDLLTSACIRILVTLNKRLNAMGGALLLCAMNAHVKEVFEVAGIAVHFKTVATQAEALARLGDAPAPQKAAKGASSLGQHLVATLGLGLTASARRSSDGPAGRPSALARHLAQTLSTRGS